MSLEIGSGTAVGMDELLPDEVPVCEGWTSAAIAICSILQFANPMVLRLGFSNHGPLYIDFQHRAYQWSTPLSSFPANPGAVEVETEPVPPGAASLFHTNGADLDGLLWMIGLAAFTGGSASWLRLGERHRLTRWPNITTLGISADQVRMTALLGSNAFTAEELALAATVSLEEARSLINAFSLMGILYSPVGQPAPVRPAAARGGLFRRLRERLGF